MTLPKQNSEKWLDWRKDKVGASDCAVLMGCSPWKTPLELYKEKKGITPPQSQSWAMKRGHELEKEARAALEIETGESFFPQVIAHEKHPRIVASLDGVTLEGIICEIKCPNKEVLAMAKDGQIPEYYEWQIQHQLACSGARKCVYYAYDGQGTGYMVDVFPNVSKHHQLISAALEFLECLDTDTPPAPTENDSIEVDDCEVVQAAMNWMVAKTVLDECKETEKIARDRLLSFSDDGNFLVTNNDVPLVEAKRVERSGSIDWKSLWSDLCEKMPEVKNVVDPTNYQKEQVGFWKLTIKS